MSCQTRHRQKGRREGGNFIAVPHAVMDSPNYRRCSGNAIKLLFDLARQYRGGNNGDLAPALVKNGLAHQAKAKALRELCHYGLLIRTKTGGLGMASLYALTWYAIDSHKTKFLEVGATQKPPGDWKETRPDYKEKARKKTPGCESAEPRLEISPLRQVSTVSKAGNQPYEALFQQAPRLGISHLLRSTKQ